MISDKNHFIILTLSLTLVVLVASASCCILPTAPEGSQVWGLMCIIATAPMVYLTRRKYADTGSSVIAMLLYLVIATSSPLFPCFSQFHAAALLNILSFLLLISFSESPSNNLTYALSVIFLVTASVFCPPMLWMTILYLLAGLIGSKEKMKTLVTGILSIAAPVAIFLAVMYLKNDLNEGILFLSGKFRQVIINQEGYRQYIPMPTLIKYAVILTGMIDASFHMIFKKKVSSNSEHLARLLTVAYLISLMTVTLIFYPGTERNALPVLCPGAALLLSGRISEDREEKGIRIYLILFTITILAERIYDLNLNIL